MSENSLSSNLTNTDSWKRLVLCVLFLFVSSLLRIAVFAVFVAQTLFVLLTGEKNTRLQSFADVLRNYIYQVIGYVTYSSDHRPFPFNDLPTASSDPSTV